MEADRRVDGGHPVDAGGELRRPFRASWFPAIAIQPKDLPLRTLILPRFASLLRAVLTMLCAVCALASESDAYVQVQMTPLGDSCPSRPGIGIRLFFRNEPVPFSYRKIALLHAVGDREAGQSEVLSSLKRRAWELGADALIEVERTTERQDGGTLFLKKGERPEEYNVVAFTGIAIAATDSSFLPESDSSFQTPKPRKPQSTLASLGEAVLFMIGGVAMLGLLAIALAADQRAVQ